MPPELARAGAGPLAGVDKPITLERFGQGDDHHKQGQRTYDSPSGYLLSMVFSIEATASQYTVDHSTWTA